MTNELVMTPQKRSHTLQLDNRSRLIATGVTDVLSFNEDEVQLVCGEQQLCVSGSGLHVSRLNLDDAQVVVEGDIEAMEDTASAAKTSLFSRVFG